MKGRLFWMILIGFWLTFLLITEGEWLMFAVLRPGPSDTTRALAKISLAAADAAIRSGGERALEAQRAAWPADERGRILVSRWSAASRIEQDIDTGNLSIRASDPAGQPWLVTYHVTRFAGFGHGPLDMPRDAFLAALLGGLGFSAILAWYLTNPIRQIRAGFGRLSAGDFSTRMGSAVGSRKDEIADLARDFDRMSEHLEELVAARDKLLSDVSHELRSPLARLQLAIGLARQDPAKLETSLQRISREAARLDEMVGELLTLSKLESGVRQAEEYFDIAEIAKIVVEDARFEASPMGVDIVLDIHPDRSGMEWIVSGSGKLMSRAVENIVRNAIRFSREGRRVFVTLEEKKPDFMLTVADEGPGVPERMIAALFKPFTQGMSGDGQGFGLGLSIAQRAVKAQGGSIGAHNRAPSGLVITVVLPAAETALQPHPRASTLTRTESGDRVLRPVVADQG